MTLRSVSVADIIQHNAQPFPERTVLIFATSAFRHRNYLARVKGLAAGLAPARTVNPRTRSREPSTWLHWLGARKRRIGPVRKRLTGRGVP